MVPGLEEWMMDGDDEQVIEIAEHVHWVLRDFVHRNITHYMWASERFFGCLSQQYQRSKGCNSWLDYSPWTITYPSNCTDCQDQSWIQSWTYWFSSLSCWARLEWFWVSVLLLIDLWLSFDPYMSMFFRIKAALRSGEMQVPGDQWPIFIYTCCEYDPEDTWKGTFRSAILVTVSET